MAIITLLARFLHRWSHSRQQFTPAGNLLPRTVHAVLPGTATRFRRVIIVGDIHGCASEFQMLLDRVFYRPGVDVLVQVGDLVNKGPASAETIRMVERYGAHVVRGNHDEEALAAFRGWQAGRKAPIKAKYAWVQDAESGGLARTLERLPFSLSLPAYGVVVVHAGMIPGKPLACQSLNDLITMRDVVPASALTAAAAAKGDNLSAESVGGGAANGAEGAPGPSSRGNWDWEAVIAEASAAAGSEARDNVVSTHENSGSLLSQLVSSEKRRPVDGRAWANVWRGPSHVFFGHDAGRRLQMEPWATGLDGGCVYGGALYAAVLPPLDDNGHPVATREAAGVPSDAQEFVLGTGLVAHLVSVPATTVHSPPNGIPTA